MAASVSDCVPDWCLTVATVHAGYDKYGKYDDKYGYDKYGKYDDKYGEFCRVGFGVRDLWLLQQPPPAKHPSAKHQQPQQLAPTAGT